MRKRINTFTQSVKSVESAVRIWKWCEVSHSTLTQNVFRQGFTRIYTGLFGFIALIRASRGCKSQEKASTILTGLYKTKPIYWQSKIQVRSVLTNDYEEKTRVASKSKQSQTKPIKGRANVKMDNLFGT